MDRQHINTLLARLSAGEASDSDREQIEQLLSDGVISIADIDQCAELQDHLESIAFPDPSASLDRGVYAMLAAEQGRQVAWSWKDLFTWPTLTSKLAFASFVLVIGIAIGYMIKPSARPGDEQIRLLSNQVTELQEMMMLSLLEKGTATERLKAVSLTQEMDEASKKVTSALIQTLNNDENTNVRLAALEALKPYAGDGTVRAALIRSISKQESPLVQISLAELMVALQEKAAVEEFEKLIESDNTPPEVKKKIRESINVLI